MKNKRRMKAPMTGFSRLIIVNIKITMGVREMMILLENIDFAKDHIPRHLFNAAIFK